MCVHCLVLQLRACVLLCAYTRMGAHVYARVCSCMHVCALEECMYCVCVHIGVCWVMALHKHLITSSSIFTQTPLTDF